MFDYTNDCEKYGCSYNDTATYGYWTSTIYGKVNSGPFVWRVSRSGDLGGSYANYDYGIRPVITISKTLISE